MAKHVDQEELMKKAAEIKGAVVEGAEKAFEKAAEATKTGVKTAGPHVMSAVDTTVKKAAPYVDSASEAAAKLTTKAGEKLEGFHEDMVSDYLPRLSAAVEDAAVRAKEEAAKAAGSAKKAVESAPVEIAAVEEVATKKRRGKVGKVFGYSLLASAAAGAGYLVWRRSRPIEDPWAEEYWADLEAADPVEEVPAEAVVAEEVVADEAPAQEADAGEEVEASETVVEEAAE